MTAIVTKYLPATKRRKPSIRAATFGIYKIIPWDDTLNGEENHRLAAIALAVELECHGKMYRVDNPVERTGWIFVLVNEQTPTYWLGKALTAAQHLA
jgi:hypothetical protein